MLRKTIASGIICTMIACSMAGCTKEQKPIEDYDIGMVYTTEYANKSEIHFLDEDMNEKGDLAWKYSGLTYSAFSNALVLDRKVYMAVLGKALKLDEGKVITFDLDTAKKIEYDFDRYNITNFTADDKKIYIAGNEGDGYIDSYDLTDNTITRMDITGIIPGQMRIYDGRIFAFGMDTGNEGFLAEFYPEKSSYEKLFSFDDDLMPGFLEEYEGNLYFAKDRILYEYDINSRQITTYDLPHENADNLEIVGNILYIAHTEKYENEDSFVELFNLDTRQIVKEVPIYGMGICQMQASARNQILYIMNTEKIRKYDISGDEPRLISESELMNEGNFYCAGFFLNEDYSSDDGNLDEPDFLKDTEDLSDEELNKKMIDWANKQEVLPDKKE